MFDSAFQDGVKRPGTREMTALLAGLMALNAFAIDAMIPALPDIGRSLHVAQENDRQLVVISYFLGFASTQLLWGPLADRFGRKPPLYVGLILFVLGGIGCSFARSPESLIAFRFLQGVGACATMVIPRAIIRDLHTGVEAARLMATTMLVFSVSPLLAPLAGSTLSAFFGWRVIFDVIAAIGLVVTLCLGTVMAVWSDWRGSRRLVPAFAVWPAAGTPGSTAP